MPLPAARKSKNPPLFSLLIPRFGEVRSFIPHIESLLLDEQLEIIVGDNGPIPLELPRHPRLIQVKLKQNTGFSHALNATARAAKGKVFVCLNPDCEVQSTQLHELWQYAQKQNWQAVSPSLGGSGYHLPLPTFFSLLWQFSFLRKLIPSFVFFRTTLPGACLLVDASVWKSISGFSEEFWLWWEDSDFSLRLQQGGIASGVAKHISVSHLGGESFIALSEVWKRHVFFHSLRIFIKKHFSQWQQWVLLPLTLRFDQHHLYPADVSIRASIVVPNMRRELLESFLKTHRDSWNWNNDELIIVTSAKDIGEVQSQYPDVIWILLEENRGFAHTVNMGFRRARGQWIGTVNDDVVLPHHFISQMLDRVSKDVGSVQPLVVDPTGNVESYGLQVDKRGRAWGKLKSEGPVDAFNGAAVMLRHEALEEVGLFDERFGSYLEDVDLSLRLTKAGWKHQVHADVQVIHQRHQTSKAQPLRKVWQDTRNWWLIVLKPYWWSSWKNAPISILMERARNVSGLLKALARAT